MAPPAAASPFSLADAAAYASLASLGSQGGGHRRGGHRRNLSAIPEAAESGEGGGGTAGMPPLPPPRRAPQHAFQQRPQDGASLHASPSPPQQPWQGRQRHPSPPSAGKSLATQAFYTAASEAPLPLTDENSRGCTADSRWAAERAPAAAPPERQRPAAAGAWAHLHGAHTAPRCAAVCGITRQPPGLRRQSVSGSRLQSVGNATNIILPSNCMPEPAASIPVQCCRTWQAT